MKLKDTSSSEEKLWPPKQHIKKQRHYFANKGPPSQSFGFSSSHVWRWELDYKENWPPKNWCFWTVVLKRTLEIPLDCKEIQPVHSKGDQSWVFIGRTDAEADTPILWPPDGKDWLSWNDPDDGNDWRWEERRMTEWDGWMASATQWTWVWVSSGSYDGQGGLACCSPWGRKSQTQLSDWTKLSPILYILVYISNCFENVFMGVQLNVSPQSIQKLKHHLPLPTTEFFQITDSSSVIRSLTCSIVSSFLNFKVLLLFALLPMVFI